MANEPATYVLVHGAWGGAWAFDRTASDLSARGQKVLVPDLRGLGNLKGELYPGITLSDHIEDVIDQISDVGINRFILVGHSYGGMVITGVAARLGARIDALCYIDAFLPCDGQSLWDITGQYEHDWYINTQKSTPGLVAPIAGEHLLNDARFGRHPLLTLTEAVQTSGAEENIPRRSYIFANDWEPTPFRRFFNLAQDDPDWEVHEAASDHDVMTNQPGQLIEILLDLAR